MTGVTKVVCAHRGCPVPAAWRWIRSDLGRVVLLCSGHADAVRALNTRHGRAPDVDLYRLGGRK